MKFQELYKLVAESNKIRKITKKANYPNLNTEAFNIFLDLVIKSSSIEQFCEEMINLRLTNENVAQAVYKSYRELQTFLFDKNQTQDIETLNSSYAVPFVGRGNKRSILYIIRSILKPSKKLNISGYQCPIGHGKEIRIALNNLFKVNIEDLKAGKFDPYNYHFINSTKPDGDWNNWGFPGFSPLSIKRHGGGFIVGDITSPQWIITPHGNGYKWTDVLFHNNYYYSGKHHNGEKYFHRLDGPAYESARGPGSDRYFIFGKEYTEKEYNREINIMLIKDKLKTKKDLNTAADLLDI
jgi:hypothetical protein